MKIVQATPNICLIIIVISSIVFILYHCSYMLLIGLQNFFFLGSIIKPKIIEIIAGALYGFITILVVVGIIVPCFVLLVNFVERRKRAEMQKIITQALRTKIKPFKQILGEQYFSCSICLQKMEKDHQVVQLFCNQKHVYHFDCLKPWAMQNQTCPLCRSKLTVQNQQIEQNNNENRVWEEYVNNI